MINKKALEAFKIAFYGADYNTQMVCGIPFMYGKEEKLVQALEAYEKTKLERECEIYKDQINAFNYPISNQLKNHWNK